MCGITGIYSLGRPIDAISLKRAAASIAHRGPDGMRTWIDSTGAVGFGHARLAIIDLPCGDQPMRTADGRFTIVFNGEIYNFSELRRTLESLGHQFRTHSDTEVLLIAFLEWGPACLQRLDGMFAFVIFDGMCRKLFLARDRTGVKPLYYYCGPDVLIFGSELKAILSWTQVPRRLNHLAIANFLRLTYTVPPATCFRDVQELEPGTFLEFSREGLTLSRYWSWQRNEEDWNERRSLAYIERELTTSVVEQLIADVPVGAFLSGGIDSSLLVALLATQGKRTVPTFTVKFAGNTYDESPYARAVACHVGTRHHEILVEAGSYDFQLAEQVLDQFDQPFGDSSAIPTYLISREIRKHVKVVIGGDGGDEMFGGYPRFLHADAARLLGTVPNWAIDATGKIANAILLGADARRQLSRLIRAAKTTGAERLTSICSLISQQELHEMATPEFNRVISDLPPAFPSPNGHFVTGGQELIDSTITCTLPGDYLRKIDVMSSAHGLEVRVPFLSNRILELSCMLPHRYKYSWKENKCLLRSLASKYLPASIAKKSKHGFGIPLDIWLGDRGRAEIGAELMARSAVIRQFIRPDAVRRLVADFVTQRWDRSRISRFGLYQRIYSLWSLERWMSKWHPST